MKVFSHQFIVIKKINTEELSINLKGNEIVINENKLKDEEILMKNLSSEYENGIIAILDSTEKVFYIHIKSSVLYATRYLNGDTLGSLTLHIDLYSKRFKIKKEDYTYSIIDNRTNESYFINKEIFITGNKPINVLKNRIEEEPYIYMKISYLNYISFLEYTIKRKEFSVKTIKYQLYNCSPDFEIEFKSANQFIISAPKINNVIHISKLIKNKFQILNENMNEDMKYAIMLSINNRLFIITKENDNKVIIHYYMRAEILFHYKNLSLQRNSK